MKHGIRVLDSWGASSIGHQTYHYLFITIVKIARTGGCLMIGKSIILIMMIMAVTYHDCETKSILETPTHFLHMIHILFVIFPAFEYYVNLFLLLNIHSDWSK